MAPGSDDELDRRGLERRIESLEKRYEALSVLVNEVKGEQKHHGEIMALSFTGVEARCTTLSRENGLIVEKIDTVRDLLTEALGDSTASPVGRELAKDIAHLKTSYAELDRSLVALEQLAAEYRGAMNFVRNSKIGALVVGLLAIVAILIRALVVAGKP